MNTLACRSFAAALVLAGVAHGQSIRYVNASAAAGGNGQSWGGAYRSLQSALDAARADGGITQVWVASGVYTPRRTAADRAESFRLVTGVQVLGGFNGSESLASQRNPAANVAVLSGDLNGNDGPNFSGRGDNSHHVVQGTDLASGRLDGFTIRGGNYDLAGDTLCGGGGVWLFRCSYTVSNCLFTGNIAGGTAPDLGGFGGGLFVQGGAVAVADCRFDSNRGMNGGAMGIWGSLVDRTCIDCFVTLDRCDFTANFSPSQTGGAIYSATADPLLPERGIRGEIRATACRFTGNHAEYYGAWIDYNATLLRLDACEFRDNFSADVGGAMGFAQTVGFALPAFFRGCLFEHNGFPAQRGSAVIAHARPAVLDSCTASDNQGSSIVQSGPVLGFSFGAKELDLRNSVIRDNTGTAVLAIRNPSLTVTNCTILRNPSTVPGGLAGGIETSAGVNTIANTILWGNHRGGVHDQAAQLRVFDTTPAVRHSIIEGLDGSLPGEGSLGLDPLFAPGTLPALSPGSPAIDSGRSSLLPADTLDLDADGDTAEPAPRDLLGGPRRLDDPASADCRFAGANCGPGPVVDIGAIEFVPAGCDADINADGNVDQGDVACLVAAIAGDGECAALDPDFNGDGNADQGDVAALVGVVAGGLCP